MTRVAATCGCFDIIHGGHLSILKACSAIGDEVVVFLNSDESVRRLKGEHKPVQPFEERAAILRAIRYVDAIVPFNEDTPAEAIEKYFVARPELINGKFFWLKCAIDCAAAGLPDPERDMIMKHGGWVLYQDDLAKRSSSAIIEQIKNGEHAEGMAIEDIIPS